MNARPITGQTVPPAVGGQGAPRPMGPGGVRPPAAVQQQAPVSFSYNILKYLDGEGKFGLHTV